MKRGIIGLSFETPEGEKGIVVEWVCESFFLVEFSEGFKKVFDIQKMVGWNFYEPIDDEICRRIDTNERHVFNVGEVLVIDGICVRVEKGPSGKYRDCASDLCTDCIFWKNDSNGSWNRNNRLDCDGIIFKDYCDDLWQK